MVLQDAASENVDKGILDMFVNFNKKNNTAINWESEFKRISLNTTNQVIYESYHK